MVGLADHAAGAVSALGEHPQQVLSDLPVPADDDDIHEHDYTPRLDSN